MLMKRRYRTEKARKEVEIKRAQTQERIKTKSKEHKEKMKQEVMEALLSPPDLEEEDA